MTDTKRDTAQTTNPTKPDDDKTARTDVAADEPTPVSATADPHVQQLLTERQTANNSGDQIRVNQINEELKQMGYDPAR